MTAPRIPRLPAPYPSLSRRLQTKWLRMRVRWAEQERDFVEDQVKQLHHLQQHVEVLQAALRTLEAAP